MTAFRAIVLAVQRQPDANTVEVVDRVQAMLPAFNEQMPAVCLDLSCSTIAQPRSVHAVEDVQFTLALTIGLVVMVIFVFLRRVAATFIPALAVPISIIATLGAMYLFGFSIDNISLLGLTLSVGLVVDDAIVMLENIVRHMEEDGLGGLRGGAEGLPRDRLHHHLDLAVAGGGVHPRAADGRRHRPHLQRVRGRGDGRDPGLGLRLADADADAVRAPAHRLRRRPQGERGGTGAGARVSTLWWPATTARSVPACRCSR